MWSQEQSHMPALSEDEKDEASNSPREAQDGREEYKKQSSFNLFTKLYNRV